MNCPTCGRANVADAKFCAACGTHLAAGCPTCGRQNEADARFCVECGTGLAPAATATANPAPQPETPTAERRLVTVLFGDLVGSTTLAEDRDPEETRNLLNRYFDTASEIIGRYGGTVEKFIGDAVMAVWGVPTAHEDDAERAVRAALDLLDAVSAITDNGQPLQMRAAVLTGEAAATVGATGQGIVAGDLVNTASRLQGAAPPGTVLVGEATKRATAEAIAYEEAGEQLLKGKTAPVAAWRAVQVLGMRGGARRRSSLEPPFVGRDEELRLVKDLFNVTVREAKPRLVTVIGQAGIGKSRLGWEFEKYIDGVTQTVYWHAGRSPSYGEGISFWALAEMVRERAGIAESDPPEEARAKLSPCLAEWVTDAEERRWVEPRVAGLLGLEEMPTGQREELFAAWRTFFQRIADRGPVILVFKDLHWADDGMLEFIEHLLTWSKSHPIYVLAMTRPDLLERHPGWGSGVRNATTVSLEPLADEAMGELLRGLVPGLPGDAVAAIVARADGVPLYAVETVRMLIDRGQLVAGADGSYTLDGAIDRLGVPETLHALVAARIDANPPEDRSLLADGAVLGQSFTLAAISGLSGQKEEVVLPALERLLRRELLIRDDDPRSPERGQYRFVQAVVREVAYDTLAKADRRTKHLAAARYFEALGDDELSGVLANHYLEALQATSPGPEADALAAQARIALRVAGERAAALHAWSVVHRHLTDALAITSEPAEAASLHMAIAQAGNFLVRPDSVDHALRAAELAEGLDDRPTLNRARGLAGEIYVNRSLGADALAILEPAAATLAENEQFAAAIFSQQARILMMTERHEEALVAAERALRAAALDRDTEQIAQALTTRGSALGGMGRLDEAEAVLRGAMVIADRGGHISAGLRARNNLVSAISEDTPYHEMMPILNDSIDLARRYGMAGWAAQHLLNTTIGLIEMGDWEQADERLAETDDLAMNESHLGAIASLRAILLAGRGEAQASNEAIAEARRGTRLIDTAPQLTDVAVRLAHAYLLLGEPKAAVQALKGAEGGGNDPLIANAGGMAAAVLADGRALASFRERLVGLADSRWSRAAAAQIAASASAMEGRWDEAQAAYLSALPRFDDMDLHLEANVLRLEFAAYLGDRFADAAAAGEAGAAWFAERGAEGVVERYRAAFRGTPAPAAGTTARAARSQSGVEVS